MFRESAGASDLDGDLAWVKPPQPAGLYAGGFSGSARVEGARYFPPAAGQPVLTVTTAAVNAKVTLTSTSFAAPLLYDAKLSATEVVRIEAPNAEHLSMRITRATGLLSGSFVAPGHTAATTISGIVQLKQQRGRGLFTGATAAGALGLAPSP